MREDRPFHRVFHVTKQQAAIEQIEAAIAAFHKGQFAVAVTLAGAAEDMGPPKPSGLWEIMRDNANLHLANEKAAVRRLNETRDWLKHEQPHKPHTWNLVAFDVSLFILRAMDKWRPWSPLMLEFKELWFASPKLQHPDDYQVVER